MTFESVIAARTSDYIVISSIGEGNSSSYANMYSLCITRTPPYRIKPLNKNIKMSSFKSSENIQKKEDGPDRSVSDNQSSSVTLNELAMEARKIL